MNIPSVPNRQQLSQFVVNREGWEAITQSFYDWQTYPAAGANSLTFFTTPVGAGGRTLSDTNMTLAGQMPTNIEFLITNIQVYFHPAVAAVTKTGAAGAEQEAIQDAYIFRRAGNLRLTIGSKAYLQEATLMRFPPANTFHLESAIGVATTVTATTLQSDSGYGDAVGRPYILSPANLLLTSNQNFDVTISWPEGLQAVSADARIGVVLAGIEYRRSQ